MRRRTRILCPPCGGAPGRRSSGSSGVEAVVVYPFFPTSSEVEATMWRRQPSPSFLMMAHLRHPGSDGLPLLSQRWRTSTTLDTAPPPWIRCPFASYPTTERRSSGWQWCGEGHHLLLVPDPVEGGGRQWRVSANPVSHSGVGDGEGKCGGGWLDEVAYPWIHLWEAG